MQEKIIQWMKDFVEKPNPKLGNWAPCPYARAARINNQINIQQGTNPLIDLKRKNAGKWWLAGEEDNAEFTHFVETWLQDWVGYVEETVFDVNVLMLDEHHCCTSNPNNEQVNTFLKKHNVEPVYVPWRHRYFWDGGLHCITLDLYREGEQKDYFPNRGNQQIEI